MEDPNLNRNLEETRELMTRWNQFHDFANMAMQQGPAKITPQAELKFLELKSRIAMLHDGFMGGVKSEVKTAQNIIQIVADCILLKKIANSSAAERQKFEFDWNECFMLLNDTVSSLDEEKKRLAGVNERAYKAAQRRDMFKARFHNFMHSPALHYGGALFAIIFIVFGFPKFGIYNWFNLYDIPALRDMYKSVAGKIYRPYFNPDLDYHDTNEMLMDEERANTDAASINAERQENDINDENFKTIWLAALGFAGNAAEAGKIFDSRKDKIWWTEHFLHQGNKMEFVGILFTNTEDAKKFIGLQKAGLETLPAEEKKKTMSRTIVFRDANLVAIGIAERPHPFVENYLRIKYRVNKKKQNELQ